MRDAYRMLVALVFLAVLAAPGGAADSKDATPVAKAEKAPMASTGVAAYLNGQPITMAEVEKAAAAGLKRIEQERFDLLSTTLDQLVAQKLIEKEAEERGISQDDLVRLEIDEKVLDPTKEEVETFYEANKQRAGGRTLEEVGNSIKNLLRNSRVLERQADFIGQLKAKAGFRVVLEPPRTRVTVPAGAPTLGPADAPITIVEYADYQCPFCRRVHPGLSRLLSEYGDRVRYVFRDYPLADHVRAVPASVAAHCAGEQGKYWDYHNALMEIGGALTDEALKQRATDLELDVEAFDTCYKAGRHEPEIQAAFEEGQRVGVTGTPSFFINGRMVVGAKPYDELKAVVEDELQRIAQAKAASGG